MTRETRANLIFLAIFLVVSIPGLILLVKKKMDPLGRPMWIPDGRLTRLVYIDPTDTPASVPRMSPAITAAWIADETRNRFGVTTVPTTPTGEGLSSPIISENRFFQLLGTKPTADGLHIYLAFWNLPRGQSKVDLQVTADGGVVSVQSTEVDIPPEIKKDLQDSGLPRPPQRLRWVEASLPTALPTGDPIVLKFTGTMDGEPFSDTLAIRAE